PRPARWSRTWASSSPRPTPSPESPTRRVGRFPPRASPRGERGASVAPPPARRGARIDEALERYKPVALRAGRPCRRDRSGAGGRGKTAGQGIGGDSPPRVWCHRQVSSSADGGRELTTIRRTMAPG